MSDRAFISLAGEDKAKAEILLSASSKFLYDIYYHDFVSGSVLVEQMKSVVKDCSLFILFASKKSLDSVWCKFEIQLAEIERIKRGIEVHVFPLEGGIPVSALPEWMKAFWLDIDFDNENTRVRRLSGLLRAKLAPPILQGAVERIEDANRLRLLHMRKYSVGPNVFFFSGPPSIGRRTTVNGFLSKIFGNDRYQNGPEIYLDDPGSVDDFYLRLKREFMRFKADEYIREQEWIRAQETTGKVDAIIELLKLSQRNHETVFVICQAGLFDEGGYLIDWARLLFQRLGLNPRVQLAVISNRQPRAEEMQNFPNVFCHHVRELEDKYVNALIQELTILREGSIRTPRPEHLYVIGGHPVLAYTYANLLTQIDIGDNYSLTGALANEQRSLMSEFLSYDRLLVEERIILSVLSWMPRIEPEPFITILEGCGVTHPWQHIRGMVLSHLINLSDGYYSIAGPIRFAFRQLHGFGDQSIHTKIAEYFKNTLRDSDDLDNEAVDRAIFVISLESGAIPEEFRTILSAGTILKVVSELYRRGKYEKSGEDLGRAISLSELASTMKAEERVLREISGVQIRSLLRLRRFPEANRMIEELESLADRNALLLRGQYHRRRNNYPEAVKAFKAAVQAGNNQDSVLHEYCTCLKKVGDFATIYSVIANHEKRVLKNAFLLDMKVSLEIGRGEFANANRTLQLLRVHLQDDYMSARREAILIARRDGDLESAESVLTNAIDDCFNESGKINADLYASRCIIRSKQGNVGGAKSDLAVVAQRHQNSEQIEKRLAVYILSAEQRHDDAIQAIDALADRTKLDDILLRDVLQRLAADPEAPGFKRAEASERLRELLPGLEKITEYDII